MVYCMWFVSVVFSIGLYLFLKELQKLRTDVSALLLSHTIKTTKETEHLDAALRSQALEGQSVNDIMGDYYG